MFLALPLCLAFRGSFLLLLASPTLSFPLVSIPQDTWVPTMCQALESASMNQAALGLRGERGRGHESSSGEAPNPARESPEQHLEEASTGSNTSACACMQAHVRCRGIPREQTLTHPHHGITRAAWWQWVACGTLLGTFPFLLSSFTFWCDLIWKPFLSSCHAALSTK